ncbi:protein trapped in endoderm-1 [Trichonephila clavata]|uniref:Protein trapped in endoderm-1 n=1 Tax=Trichonephila clavata TaxID=2740835 RepID=A0A8X6IW11_TRICU|nr:protein trapped in endoderm-1 [Trichonephila clavata]
MDFNRDSNEKNIPFSMNFSDYPHIVPDRPSTATCVLAAFCCILFILLGCMGNLMTIIALTKCRKLRNATTAFVVSLAVADFLFCAVCLPLTATRYIYKEWILGDTLCTMFPFFFYGNVAASLMSMTAITFNR